MKVLGWGDRFRGACLEDKKGVLFVFTRRLPNSTFVFKPIGAGANYGVEAAARRDQTTRRCSGREEGGTMLGKKDQENQTEASSHLKRLLFPTLSSREVAL